MDLSYTPEHEVFRQQVRQFLQEKLPASIAEKVLTHRRLKKEEFVLWHKTLAAQGWSVPAWSTQFGGTGWSAVERHIFDEECANAGAPGVLPFGVAMVAPVIMAFGNDAQKNYYLPRIKDCTDWWCQGYSEPGSGSDLASLKMRAERVGDDYIVNGQKTWTTLAQHADMIFCLVRTDPETGKPGGRRQEGISFLLIDMKSPGVTVRPIYLLDEEHEVNEVWFDNVKVPVQNLIGEENKGWTYAKYLLGHERTGIARVGNSKRELAFLKSLAKQEQRNGKPLLEDALFANKLATLEIELMALELTCLRVASSEGKGKGPGPEASLLKVKGTEIQQRLTELMMEAVGPYGIPFDRDYIEGDSADSSSDYNEAAPLTGYYLNYRKTSIYGGSNEIQKNIIAQMVLGL